MITDITVKVKNSEQTYAHKFSTDEPVIVSIDSLQIKDMINTAIKCMNIAENALSESLDIEIKTSTKWQ